MATEFAIAVKTYVGFTRGELSFREGDILEIKDKTTNGWWLGTNSKGDFGCFPYYTVEILDGYNNDEVNEYQRSLNRERDSLNSLLSIYNNLFDLGIVTGTTVRDGIVYYDLEVQTVDSGKKEKNSKSMADFRILDKVLESEGVHVSLGGLVLPPMWADNTDMKLCPAAAKLRIRAMQMYITTILSDPVAEVILHCFLFPDRPVDLRNEIRAKLKNQIQETLSLNNRSLMGRSSFVAALQKLPVLARAKAAWKPRDNVELGLIKDDIVAILETSTTLQGWWEAQTSSGNSGLVPYMYVEILSESETMEFFSPDINPKSASKAREKNKRADKFGRSSGFIGNISVDGKEDLMAIGIAVEDSGKPAKVSSTNERPQLGDVVVVDYEANLWNPDTYELDMFDKAENLEFIIGSSDIIDGLSEALQRMHSNQSARVFLAPNLAFGPVGFPPDVPPNAFLCYDITLKQIVESDTAPELPPYETASSDNDSLRSSMMFQGLEMYHKGIATMSAVPDETKGKTTSNNRKPFLREDEEQIMEVLRPKKEKGKSSKPQRKLSRVQEGLRVFNGNGGDGENWAKNEQHKNPPNKSVFRLTGMGNRGSTFENLRQMVDTTLTKMNAEPPPAPVSHPNLTLKSTEQVLTYLPPGNPVYVKYKKMLQSGMSENVVVSNLEMDGIDPTGFLQTLVADKTKVVEEYKSKLANTANLAVKMKPAQQRLVLSRNDGSIFASTSDEPDVELEEIEPASAEYHRYRDMVRTGLSREVCFKAILEDGYDAEAFFDLLLLEGDDIGPPVPPRTALLASPLRTHSKNNEAIGSTPSKSRKGLLRPNVRSNAYQKYKVMLSKGISPITVKAEMKKDGIDPTMFADGVLGI